MLEHSTIIQQLEEHSKLFEKVPLRDLFNQDPNRFQQFSLEFNGLLFDFSKNFLTKDSLSLLLELAKACQLKGHIEALFTGQKVNTTEDRAALHTALRNPSLESFFIEGSDITKEISNTLTVMEGIVSKIYRGEWLGFSGKPIKDVVNLGIGGSHLGPAMATQALTPYHTNRVKCHFVSNIDETDILEATKNLNPETTLFIVASKSFTTQETIRNATTAKKWLLKSCPDESLLATHFIAVTANQERAASWGIKHILPIWDWVGGRFSIWSAIGLPIAISIGMDNFKQFLQGAHDIDDHFRNTEISKNIPIIWGLLNIWYLNFFDVRSYAILPYDDYLKILPAYLQQLEMESNGKSRRKDGSNVNYSTSPVIWGMVGSNGQHAFHQYFHQGTQLTPIDFILPIHSHHPLEDHHTWLVANCLSQSKALMLGKTAEEVRLELQNENMSPEEIANLLPHKILLGNRPSNTLLLPKLSPYTLGALIALYEHKVYVQSTIWDINCFDQWGVEVGKQFTAEIFKDLSSDTIIEKAHDSSTQGLINYYKRNGA